MAHLVDILFQFLIGVQRYSLPEVIVGLDGGKQMVTPVLRVLGTLHESCERLHLHRLTLILIFLQFFLAGQKNL